MCLRLFDGTDWRSVRSPSSFTISQFQGICRPRHCVSSKDSTVFSFVLPQIIAVIEYNMTDEAWSDAVTDPTSLADELSQSLRSGFLHSSEYDSVNVLLIYWEDDDLGCLEEINAVKSMFEGAFSYGVHTLSIPFERSQATLQSDLSQFVLLYGSKVQSLLVMYYAGHGDPSTDLKKAVWAA